MLHPREAGMVLALCLCHPLPTWANAAASEIDAVVAQFSGLGGKVPGSPSNQKFIYLEPRVDEAECTLFVSRWEFDGEGEKRRAVREEIEIPLKKLHPTLGIIKKSAGYFVVKLKTESGAADVVIRREVLTGDTLKTQEGKSREISFIDLKEKHVTDFAKAASAAIKACAKAK